MASSVLTASARSSSSTYHCLSADLLVYPRHEHVFECGNPKGATRSRLALVEPKYRALNFSDILLVPVVRSRQPRNISRSIMKESHMTRDTTDSRIRVDCPRDILESIGIYNCVGVGAEDN